MADIFEEVDEDVRRDRFAELWKRYGVFFLAACIAVVVATGAWVGYREWRESKRLELAERYRSAAELAQKNQPAQAADAFAALAQDASGGYGVLARLRLAAAQSDSGDRAAAAATYDRLAADGGVEKVYRDLATLLAAMLLADEAPGAEIDRRLETLLGQDNPWRYLAREVKGLTALREGRMDAAKQDFQALADDAEAPGPVRGRAQQLLQAIGRG